LQEEGREVEDDEIGVVGSQDEVTRKLLLCSRILIGNRHKYRRGQRKSC
jgi:hypothetical protein